MVRSGLAEVAALKGCLASWATRRGGFGEFELMAGQGGRQGRRRWRSEMLLAEAMLARIGCGVKPGVAHAALAFRGCVPEHAGDEFSGVQGEVLALAQAVVEIGEGDAGVVEVQAAVRAERAALDVSRQVQGDAAAVGVWGFDLEVPVGAPLDIDEGLPMRLIVRAWQGEAMLTQGVLQGGEKAAPEGLAQGLDRQQEFGSGVVPGVGGVEAAGGDQAVQVRVLAEVAAPGVQGHEQARHGAQMVLIRTQCQQARAGGVEQHLRHGCAVELPQREQDVGQAEDDVEVRARQQPGQQPCQPLVGEARRRSVGRTCGGRHGAGWCRSALAGKTADVSPCQPGSTG